MITNQDRSGWFGASDTATICGSWTTKTFDMFWLEKMGVCEKDFSNKYMATGNIVEHAIIDKIAEITGRKIKKGKRPLYDFRHRLRVNYDGLCENVIEVKTTKEMFETVPIAHWRQCQILMYKTKRNIAELWAYELLEEEYDKPYYLEIDEDRLKKFVVERDDKFIQKHLKVLKYLKKCLKKRRYPTEAEFAKEVTNDIR